jgi:diguanylate cyclase (GGDEF)-like protein
LGARQALVNEARARVDPVTGTATRAELEAVLARRLAGSSVPAVAVLELEGFADVNETLGHQHGDRVLRGVAGRLEHAVGDGDLVAHIHGSAFAVLCDAGHVDAVVTRCRDALQETLELAGLEIDLGAFAGIASGPAEDASALLREADVAVRRARERRVRALHYEPAMGAGAASRVELVPHLRRAIAAGELVLHYQPKLDLRTGALAGVEALVRWDRPGHGLVPPGMFIDVAERTGLIRPLTTWVLGAALADQAAWAATSLRTPVAVNLSARVLQPAVVAEVAALLPGAAAGGGLELEVTESAAMIDPVEGLAVLEELAGLGVRLSVDDFGTGHSSLAYLERLPVAALKIDRSFMAGLAERRAGASIVTATIELGHRLGLDVVAEGVEDEATLAALRGLGCDLAQGFLIGRPMPAAALREWAAHPPAMVTAGCGDSSATRSAAASAT